MKTARVYLPKERLCESSGPYVKPVKNLFRSPATTECLGTQTRIGVSSFIGLNPRV